MGNTPTEIQSIPLLIDGERRGSQESSDMEHQSQPAMAKYLINKIGSTVHPAHITTIMKRLGYCMVPQLLRSYIWEDHAPMPKQFATSYLNGLRGMTAIKVFTFHYMMAYTDFTHYPWRMDERHDRLLAVPIVRYFYSGFTSHIFFGVAGYLTSLRLFQLLDKNDTSAQAKVLASVAGSLFRRGFRLYLPVFIITLITATYIYLGLYEKNRPLLLDWTNLFPGSWNEIKPDQFPTYSEQLYNWAQEMYHLTNVVSLDTCYPLYDQHLWSILSEMRASLHLHGCLIALSLCKRNVRVILLPVIAFIYFLWDRWEVWVYILGAEVAQIDIILTERDEKRQQPLLTEKDEVSDAQRKFHGHAWDSGFSILRYTGFLVVFYLLSFPIYGKEHTAPGYETLKTFIPEWTSRPDKFYSNIGTILLLLLLARSDPNTSKWRKICTASIPQYLGTISFGFYLVQGPLLHLFGYLIPHHIWWAFGAQGKDVGDMAWFFPIAIGWTISLVVTLCVADVWSREVEGRCIRFVKWLEGVCFKK